MKRITLPLVGMTVLLALALPTAATSTASVSRPMSGSCAAVPVVVPSPNPAALFRVEITGWCRLTHLGLAELAAVEDVFLGPTGLFLAGAGSYTAADGSSLDTTFTGPVRQTGPTSVAFSGTETYVGGSGRFNGATGSHDFEGGAGTAPPGQPGVGWFTVDGSITY
jgi:hypothetical protein